jgi:hypothetical protein
VPGNNANPGTSASAPKQNLAGMNLSALPAGTRLLFARGGAWTNFTVSGLRNLNVTSANPLVFDAYTPSSGASATPWLKTASGNAMTFGVYQDTAQDGGYVIRNLKFDGVGTGNWGIWLNQEMRDVTIENVEITGFDLAVHTQSVGTQGTTRFTLRNSNIHHNRGMGMLGNADNMVITGNTFSANNYSGSAFNHAIYLASGNRLSRNVTVSNNTFTNNSVVNGVCTGGNFTVHGQWDGVVVENNRITQNASAMGCWGVSITPAYATPESFRNVVVRGNRIVNLGATAIGVGSAPGILIESNVVRSTLGSAVAIPAIPPSTGDVADGNATIRNNTFCGVASNPVLLHSGATATQSGNTVSTLSACPA